MDLILSVFSGFALAIVAPYFHRFGRGVTGNFLAVLPLGLLFYFLTFIPDVKIGKVITETYSWIPTLGIQLSFYLDGLALLFVLLISGIGGIVLVYAGGYLAGNPNLGRFYALILLFMASMLGVVLSDNVITLFIFWELTSLISYFLIGFEHEREAARSAALQALLVTGTGGLALMAGLIILSQIGGTLELSGLLHQKEVICEHGLYQPVLLLILAGAFTKSAQFPFHFWLPNAMEAPAPVSAYLHSATMVKAGVYLLARFNPILGGTNSWFMMLVVVGSTTMLIGAYLAFHQTHLKRFLAYTTVSSLGMLTFMIGLGSRLAVKGAVVFLLAHSLYKCALFMVAGIIYHETGERDVGRLGGIGRVMPFTASSSILAALSMAGIPPLLGFIGKELIYDAARTSPNAAIILVVSAVLANILIVAVACTLGIKPFVGVGIPTFKKPLEAPWNL